MKYYALLMGFLLFASSVYGEEAAPASPGGAEGEAKKPQPLKPRPDSVISTVMALPVVRKWSEWIDSKHDGSSLTVWGESLKSVEGYPCWSVAVGEDSRDGVRVWRRFCVQKTGLEIWVESIPIHDGDEIDYTPYDSWQLKCDPTPSSAGKC